MAVLCDIRYLASKYKVDSRRIFLAHKQTAMDYTEMLLVLIRTRCQLFGRILCVTPLTTCKKGKHLPETISYLYVIQVPYFCHLIHNRNLHVISLLEQIILLQATSASNINPI